MLKRSLFVWASVLAALALLAAFAAGCGMKEDPTATRTTDQMQGGRPPVPGSQRPDSARQVQKP